MALIHQGDIGGSSRKIGREGCLELGGFQHGVLRGWLGLLWQWLYLRWCGRLSWRCDGCWAY